MCEERHSQEWDLYRSLGSAIPIYGLCCGYMIGGVLTDSLYAFCQLWFYQRLLSAVAPEYEAGYGQDAGHQATDAVLDFYIKSGIVAEVQGVQDGEQALVPGVLPQKVCAFYLAGFVIYQHRAIYGAIVSRVGPETAPELQRPFLTHRKPRVCDFEAGVCRLYLLNGRINGYR